MIFACISTNCIYTYFKHVIANNYKKSKNRFILNIMLNNTFKFNISKLTYDYFTTIFHLC